MNTLIGLFSYLKTQSGEQGDAFAELRMATSEQPSLPNKLSDITAKDQQYFSNLLSQNVCSSGWSLGPVTNTLVVDGLLDNERFNKPLVKFEKSAEFIAWLMKQCALGVDDYLPPFQIALGSSLQMSLFQLAKALNVNIRSDGEITTLTMTNIRFVRAFSLEAVDPLSVSPELALVAAFKLLPADCWIVDEEPHWLWLIMALAFLNVPMGRKRSNTFDDRDWAAKVIDGFKGAFSGKVTCATKLETKRSMRRKKWSKQNEPIVSKDKRQPSERKAYGRLNDSNELVLLCGKVKVNMVEPGACKRLASALTLLASDQSVPKRVRRRFKQLLQGKKTRAERERREFTPENAVSFPKQAGMHAQRRIKNIQDRMELDINPARFAANPALAVAALLKLGLDSQATIITVSRSALTDITRHPLFMTVLHKGALAEAVAAYPIQGLGEFKLFRLFKDLKLQGGEAKALISRIDIVLHELHQMFDILRVCGLLAEDILSHAAAAWNAVMGTRAKLASSSLNDDGDDVAKLLLKSNVFMGKPFAPDLYPFMHPYASIFGYAQGFALNSAADPSFKSMSSYLEKPLQLRVFTFLMVFNAAYPNVLPSGIVEAASASNFQNVGKAWDSWVASSGRTDRLWTPSATVITKCFRPPPLPALDVTDSNLLDAITAWVDAVITRLVYHVMPSPENVIKRGISLSLKPTAAAMVAAIISGVDDRAYFDPHSIYNKL